MNTPSIFQPNAHAILIHILLNLSYMFRCVTHHRQGEHRITCSKPSACCNDVVLCYVGYVTEHKIHNSFIDLQSLRKKVLNIV